MKTAVNDSYPKLKTLKDILIGEYYDEFKENLRQEAIKWYRNRYHRMDDSHWLTFFNITEDDLK